MTLQKAPVACSCPGEQKVLVAGGRGVQPNNVGCGQAASLQQHVKGSLVGASMIHVGEMIAENLFCHLKLVGMERKVEAPGVGDCSRGWGG